MEDGVQTTQLYTTSVERASWIWNALSWNLAAAILDKLYELSLPLFAFIWATEYCDFRDAETQQQDA